ncbi:type I-E CRISPR-associated endoribonuclease Cas2 [Formicincola oecophyllae]|uniref:Type I-E CRISPR-associated endoribonuclease Cas2 n=1 Tax=Formicincola oecophyllae TaxID=2558361 RepID=A0A4Y6UAI1_9PROT|nr:type I-E CRISPR-associated endoribonuclease Cas2e [Formicincola oecophyllae]QDH13391.1 type I-E CRISPR-associated endoribonuclease Cas2 [Formicincola oecophyllae]
MPMTIVVTSNVESRYRGFLTSIMLEVAAGVYVSPRMSVAVRERTWKVLTEWWWALGNGSLTMVWPDKNLSGGVGMALLGEAPKDIIDADGVLLVRRIMQETATPIAGGPPSPSQEEAVQQTLDNEEQIL